MLFKDWIWGILSSIISTAICSFYSNKIRKVFRSKSKRGTYSQKDFEKIKLQFYTCFPLGIISAHFLKSTGIIQGISIALFFLSFFFVWCSFECLKDMFEDNNYQMPHKESNDK